MGGLCPHIVAEMLTQELCLRGGHAHEGFRGYVKAEIKLLAIAKNLSWEPVLSQNGRLRYARVSQLSGQLLNLKAKARRGYLNCDIDT